MSKTRYAFTPDYSVPPGEILAEMLEARQLSQAELAARCELSEKHVSQIITGKASITSDTALLLERTLGVAASLWLNLESSHRLYLARQAERTKLEEYASWAAEFPRRELAARGYVASARTAEERVKGLLGFFGVTSPDAWERQYAQLAVAYRGTEAFARSREAVAAWLRIGEIDASRIDTAQYDRAAFRGGLQEIRGLTRLDPAQFEPRMVALCQAAGVALVFVPELPKTRLSGATRWLSADRAMIIQSLRYRTDDQFWFTFFHEAAHILLHGKRTIFVDEAGAEKTAAEDEADRFAADLLIPPAAYRQFVEGAPPSRARVEKLANRLGIAPGIVVGRLQHDGAVPFNWFQDLKRAVQFA
ncbi:MAG: HigA family addiction module antitoxin [Candidatus Bipolaricaulota bacterium]|nr:HigA family addiction module antitoxin [Candidatus Bipolaricaulota bacterium]